MEEIILCIYGTNVNEVSKALKEGWRVKAISSFCEPIAVANSYGITRGDFGAYVVLTRGE